LEILGPASGELGDAVDFVSRAVQPRRLHQQNETALFSRQPFQQTIRNETRKPGYEECLPIRH
jgi:hypothetical protein